MTLKGWIKDPPHQYKPFRIARRALLAQASAGPTNYDIPTTVPIYDQGPIGSCVLNATTAAVNIILDVEKQKTAMLSRLFLYWLCRSLMSTTTEDSGTYVSMAVERVKNIGVCEERFWEYNLGNLYQAPTPDTYPEASDNKATDWFRIDTQGTSRLDDMETSIRANHPIVFGTPVDSTIQLYQAGDVLTVPNNARIIGGHSMLFTGVRYLNSRRLWVVRNSWSSLYGNAGYLLMDDSWAVWPELDDLTVLTRMDPLMF